jgi:hypothetical protein
VCCVMVASSHLRFAGVVSAALFEFLNSTYGQTNDHGPACVASGRSKSNFCNSLVVDDGHSPPPCCHWCE